MVPVSTAYACVTRHLRHLSKNTHRIHRGRPRNCRPRYRRRCRYQRPLSRQSSSSYATFCARSTHASTSTTPDALPIHDQTCFDSFSSALPSYSSHLSPSTSLYSYFSHLPPFLLSFNHSFFPQKCTPFSQLQGWASLPTGMTSESGACRAATPRRSMNRLI